MKKYKVILFVIVLVLAVFLVINFWPKENINYEIIRDLNVITTERITDRGYEITKKDDSYYLVIYYGEVNTYYTSLNVDKVNVINNTVKVVVSLPKSEGMGEAFSYPKAIIKLDKEPKKVKITYR